MEYFVNGMVSFGNGHPIAAEDNVFDELTENFAATIHTYDLNFGTQTVYIATKDAYENWALDSFTFEIPYQNPSNWTKYGKDLLNTSSNPYSTFTYPVKLRYGYENPVTTEPPNFERAIIIDTFLVYTFDKNFSGTNRLFCRNVESGDIIWEKDFSLMIGMSPPVFGHERVYLQMGEGLLDRKLGCYDLATGEEIWITDYVSQGNDFFGPVVYRDKILIVKGIEKTELAAYDAFSGEFLWETLIHPDKLHTEWIPAIFEDTIYAYAEYLVALNPENGETHYSQPPGTIPIQFGTLMKSSAVVDSLNRQLIISSSDFTHAFSLETRTINWNITSDTRGKFRISPAVYDGKLYVLSEDYITEHDLVTGEILWEYPTTPAFKSYQPVVNDQIIAITQYTETWIFDRNTHERKIVYPLGGELTLGEDCLVIGSRVNGSFVNGEFAILEYDPDGSFIFGEMVLQNDIACFGDSTGVIEAVVYGDADAYTTNGMSQLPKIQECFQD